MSLLLKLRPLCKARLSGNLFQIHSAKLSTTCSTYAANTRIRRMGNPDVERSFMDRDKVPPGYELIYRAPMENYVSAAKHTSTLTASLISVLAAYKYAYDIQYISLPYELNLGGLVSHESDIWWFATGFVLINLAIRVFVSKFPLRIYKNNDTYLAVYDPQLPLTISHHTFQKGQVAELRHAFNPWNNATYRLGRRSSLLLIDYFRTPSEFHQMCGLH